MSAEQQLTIISVVIESPLNNIEFKDLFHFIYAFKQLLNEKVTKIQ